MIYKIPKKHKKKVFKIFFPKKYIMSSQEVVYIYKITNQKKYSRKLINISLCNFISVCEPIFNQIFIY